MKTITMKVSYINDIETKKKLQFVKLIKEYSRDADGNSMLGLKECKNHVDSISLSYSKNNTKDYFEINVFSKINQSLAITTFENLGVKVMFVDRQNKMKRLLYSDQKVLIEAMLMENWEDFVTESDKKNVSYIQAKENAVEKIIKKYEKYINYDFFTNLNIDINRINKIESKDIGFKFMKFNEEFGEFNAEYIKFKGLTYKEYNRNELLGEMADSLQVLLSIYDHIGGETNITIKDVLEKISEKNIKWETKIKDYKKNKKIENDDINFLLNI